MRKNRLRELWAQGKGTANAWCSTPSSFTAELMAHQGWESVTIDCQHGLIDYQTAVTMLQAISTTDTVPMVRVPWREPGILMKMLDAGSYGVICPMVNTVGEAKELVEACSYPPLGQRSFGPIRATVYGGADYHQHANDEILVIAMIETKTALANVDEIMAVEGLDGLYVGPADLAISLGVTPGFDPTDRTVLDAIAKILAAAKKHGKFAGIHCGYPAFGKRMIEDGFDFVTLMNDTRIMNLKAQEFLEEFRSAPSGGPQSSTY
ncbi:MAG: 2,4-dihydroxyhept-2-ene-1,7-dioic acid aldolase [Geminicoccaceae bacterium]|nr:2,4-dihydroxyhept-2-ene-1,7-dioic acid aldolase [Geminicoccaceae bacterium]